MLLDRFNLPPYSEVSIPTPDEPVYYGSPAEFCSRTKKQLHDIHREQYMREMYAKYKWSYPARKAA